MLKTNEDKKVAAEKTAAPEVAAAPEVVAAPQEDANLGKDCGKVAFKAPLGNPAQSDTTTYTDKVTGKSETKVTSTIVGYRFQAIEDIRIPDCGTTENLKKNPMDFKDIDNWKAVRAGEEFDLTSFEAALLLSQPGFNGTCTGGEKPVVCTYPKKMVRQKDGTVMASAAEQTPRVTIRAQLGSIKDFAIIDVLTCTTVTGENGQPKKNKTINPGFEKWAPLCANATRKASGAKKAKNSANVRNGGAEAFMAYVAKASKK